MKGIQLFDESVKQQIIKDYAVMIIPKIIDKYDISNDGFYSLIQNPKYKKEVEKAERTKLVILMGKIMEAIESKNLDDVSFRDLTNGFEKMLKANLLKSGQATEIIGKKELTDEEKKKQIDEMFDYIESTKVNNVSPEVLERRIGKPVNREEKQEKLIDVPEHEKKKMIPQDQYDPEQHYSDYEKELLAKEEEDDDEDEHIFMEY